VWSLSDTQIFNRALVRIGQPYDQVTAVDGTDTSGTKWGQIALLEYQSTRDEELMANEWKFATKRAALTLVSTVTNNTGYWYMYQVPADCLHTCFIYSVLPQWVFTYPRKYLHIVLAPFINEQGYYYTDLDPTNGNPYAKYIQELPLGYTWTDHLFVDALTIRLASKLLPAATARVDGIAEPYQQEYQALLYRAVGKNALDKEDDLPASGNTWWSDRGPFTGDWGGPP